MWLTFSFQTLSQKLRSPACSVDPCLSLTGHCLSAGYQHGYAVKISALKTVQILPLPLINYKWGKLASLCMSVSSSAFMITYIYLVIIYIIYITYTYLSGYIYIYGTGEN